MEVGIGLPNAVPGTTGEQLAEWAREAEAAGFSSLGTIDRITYPNLEPMVALAAAAAVTSRIRLATTILIAPLRASATLLAKQAASVQRISDGRLVFGLAVGGREDDFQAVDADFGARGDRFEQMLDEMKGVWAESSASSGAPGQGASGPDVSGSPPQVIIGGSVDAAYRRAAEHGDGWIMGGGTPEMLAEGREKTRAAWRDAGREGEPRIMALAYYSLGDQAGANAESYLGDYYAWLGEYAGQIVSSAATDGDTVKGYQAAFEEAGCDELVWFPSSPDPQQVELLASAAL